MMICMMVVEMMYFKLIIVSNYDRIRDFAKWEDRVDLRDFDINKLGVFESGKNIKVHTDENKSDLLAIIYGYNSKDLNGLIKSIIIVWFLEFKIKAFALLNRFCDENNKDVFN